VIVCNIGLALENFSPVLDFKERVQQLRWIGHGCDSDAELATLYEYWLVNHGNELFDPSTLPPVTIPPPRMCVCFTFVEQKSADLCSSTFACIILIDAVFVLLVNTNLMCHVTS